MRDVADEFLINGFLGLALNVYEASGGFDNLASGYNPATAVDILLKSMSVVDNGLRAGEEQAPKKTQLESIGTLIFENFLVALDAVKDTQENNIPEMIERMRKALSASALYPLVLNERNKKLAERMETIETIETPMPDWFTNAEKNSKLLFIRDNREKGSKGRGQSGRGYGISFINEEKGALNSEKENLYADLLTRINNAQFITNNENFNLRYRKHGSVDVPDQIHDDMYLTPIIPQGDLAKSLNLPPGKILFRIQFPVSQLDWQSRPTGMDYYWHAFVVVDEQTVNDFIQGASLNEDKTLPAKLIEKLVGIDDLWDTGVNNEKWKVTYRPKLSNIDSVIPEQAITVN